MTTYLFILIVTWPLRYLSWKQLHQLGAVLGLLAYYCLPKFRKRSLSNLALASDLNLSNLQIRRYAKESLQNLLITCLEYAKLASTKDIHEIAICLNPEEASALMAQGQSPIFFCGHLANWELLFLEGTSRMPGVAIGRPINNVPLYDWVLSIREKFGGKIIPPKSAIKEGLRGLKQGSFLGIVGDQGMPDSGFCSPFLGRLAWTSPVPAILCYRTGHPLIVATLERKKGTYWIHYSEPLFPNKERTMEEEIDRLMRASLQGLENAIKKNPGQWLWSHNRWKQQTPERLKSRFRHESILLVLPQQGWEELSSQLHTFREIYPREFITIYAPKRSEGKIHLKGAEWFFYTDPKQLFQEDYRFKLVFNFTSLASLERHFKKLAAFTVVGRQELLRYPQLKQLILKEHAS
jgi:KDO2-lipid IV(A) lauroyltransferase